MKPLNAIKAWSVGILHSNLLLRNRILLNNRIPIDVKNIAGGVLAVVHARALSVFNERVF